MAIIQRIRRKIIDREYFLSSHAEEKMWEDRLERSDIENAIFKGRIEKRLTKDPRGTRYRIEGPASDGRLLHVVARINEEGSLVIITAYCLED